MATVNTQDNPVVVMQGAKDSDITIISSQITSDELVEYQIEKIATGEVLTFDNRMNGKRGGNLVAVNKTELRIILEFRTKYRARAKSQFGDWSAWVNFTTRDKRYQSPHAITQLTDDTDATAQTQGHKIVNGEYVAQGGSRTIVVTNNARATEQDDARRGYNLRRAWGPVTVTNTDTVFNDGQLQTIRTPGGGTANVPVVDTLTGAKVINVPAGKNARIRYTNRGATVNSTV